ncbi:protein YmiD [Escherichia coli]|nr:protein YmiD [Escherichia coli]
MQKLPLKEKCLTATANYHPGIRYIMTGYIYSSTYARFR